MAMSWISNKFKSVVDAIEKIDNKIPRNDSDNEGDNDNDNSSGNGNNNESKYKKSNIAENQLSLEAKKMIYDAVSPYTQTPHGCISDFMVNLYGTGSHSQCFVNKEAVDIFHNPINTLKFKSMASGCGVLSVNEFDTQYMYRLVSLVRNLRRFSYPFGKHMLCSIDQRYDYSGEALPNLTGYYVPNDYLFDIVNDYKDLFTPCISIHPYRKDCVDELIKYAVLGVRYVVWSPISMGINPSSELCDDFYETLIQNDMILFIHTGDEHVLVDAPESDNKWGNPLLLRRPLNLGVKIVAVHSGGEGKSQDIDEKYPHPLVPNINLFLRIMHEPRYTNNLVGDISGIVAHGRVDSIIPLLDHQNIHNRLINGSDYPLPAVNTSVLTILLAKNGLITSEERDIVNEIYNYNPILFDFVLKRILRSPSGKQFCLSIFRTNSFFDLKDKSNILFDSGKSSPLKSMPSSSTGSTSSSNWNELSPQPTSPDFNSTLSNNNNNNSNNFNIDDVHNDDTFFDEELNNSMNNDGEFKDVIENGYNHEHPSLEEYSLQ
ncbi:hypothetical protein CYY_001508 [Polysphondylium violaceum]|uniref:Uncharacterized protein n=1 Tax=Polysphondylium violaceum TaxID=133409 RepID=A0A8J4Q2Z9_9MYCE|nr:hypothetical protein CYY_001508 [Polysphondylium violaceum]